MALINILNEDKKIFNFGEYWQLDPRLGKYSGSVSFKIFENESHKDEWESNPDQWKSYKVCKIDIKSTIVDGKSFDETCLLTNWDGEPSSVVSLIYNYVKQLPEMGGFEDG